MFLFKVIFYKDVEAGSPLHSVQFQEFTFSEAVEYMQETHGIAQKDIISIEALQYTEDEVYPEGYTPQPVD